MIKILPTQRRSSGSLYTQQQGKTPPLWPPEQCGFPRAKKKTHTTRRQFDAAMAAKDSASVSRFAKLFHPLGEGGWACGDVGDVFFLGGNLGT